MSLSGLKRSPTRRAFARSFRMVAIRRAWCLRRGKFLASEICATFTRPKAGLNYSLQRRSVARPRPTPTLRGNERDHAYGLARTTRWLSLPDPGLGVYPVSSLL